MSTSTRAIEPRKKTHSHRLPTGRLSPDLLAALAADLESGAVAIFPTETVYGIGTSAFSISGVRRIYALKGRRERKPLAVLVSELASAVPLVQSIPPEATRLAKAFWPGPLTLVFAASPLGQLITGGLTTVGIRIPDHPIALSILRAAKVPLATTSVNRSGEEPATSGAQSRKLFGNQVDWLLDSGACRVKVASSVVDLSHFPFTVIREGAISKKKLEDVLWGSHGH